MRIRSLFSLFLACGLLGNMPLAQADFTPAQPLIEALKSKAKPAGKGKKVSKRAKMELALARHIDEVQNKGGDVDKELSSGNTALMLAVALGEREAARYLLLFGADPSKQNAKGKCALDLARDDAMRTLLKEEAPLLTWEEANKVFEDAIPLINDQYNNYKSCIESCQKAFDSKDTESCLKALGSLIYRAEKVPPRLVSFLMRQVYPTKPDSAGNWWLHLLDTSDKKFELAENRERMLALITSYSYCVSPDKLTVTAICDAAIHGHYDFIKTMIERGADPMAGQTDMTDTEVPVTFAANKGHKEIVELIMEHHKFTQEELDTLLTKACSSRNHRTEEMERFILKKGGKYSRKCLLEALEYRDEAWMVKVFQTLGIKNKAELTQLLIDVLAPPTYYTENFSAPRSALIKKLVNDGADVHALERMPQGMEKHPLYTYFGMHLNVASHAPLDTYETLVKLGMNEEAVLTLPMTPNGNTLIEAIRYSMLYYMAGRIVALPVKDKKLPEDLAKGDYKTLNEIMQGLPITNKKWLNYEAKLALSVGALSLVDKLLSQGANLEEACTDTRHTKMELYYRYKHGNDHWDNREEYAGKNMVQKWIDKPYLQSDVHELGCRVDNHAMCSLLENFAQERSRKTLEYLISKGVDMKKVLNTPIAPQKSRTTLLMYAAMDSLMGRQPIRTPISLEAMEWLLEHGADPMAKDCDGNTALDFATDEKKKALLRAAMEKAQKK